MSSVPTLLVIAGSDSGAGAGIQADLKSALAQEVHATTVITAVTAQNSLGVQGIWPLPLDAVRSQFRSVMDDIGAGAIKVGMLGTRELVLEVVSLLEPYVGTVPIVVDPVCASKHGDSLLAQDALSALRDALLPLATVITPNLPEAALLTGTSERDNADEHIADALVNLGPEWVLLKGGHGTGEASVDLLTDGEQRFLLKGERNATVHTHGTGCTLASALASWLARGSDVPTAAGLAKAYITGAIAGGYSLGAGIGPVDHAWLWRD